MRQSGKKPDHKDFVSWAKPVLYFIERENKKQSTETKKGRKEGKPPEFLNLFFFKFFCNVFAFFHIVVLHQLTVLYTTVPHFNSLNPHTISVVLIVPVLQRWHRGSLKKLLSSHGSHNLIQAL